MMSMAKLVLGVAAIAAGVGSASGQLIITELRTKALSSFEDYFELTNLGPSSIDISGWSFDDESALFGDAAALEGITTIGAGETVVFVQGSASSATAFRGEWGGLAGVQVGSYDGAGLGKGDGITIFNTLGDIEILFTYGMTSPEQTHAGDWAAGNFDGSDTFENNAAVWVPGTDPQAWAMADGVVFGTVADSFGNFGSPGVIPAPGAVALLGLGGLAATRRRRG